MFNCFGDNAATDIENQLLTKSTPTSTEGSDEDDEMDPEHLTALEDLHLSPHRKCKAHTFYLIAKDMEKVTEAQ